MDLRLDRSALRRGLAALLGAVMAAGLVTALAEHLLPSGRDSDLISFFSLSYETNLPTWVSSLLLAACSGVLCGIAIATRRLGARGTPWWGLVAIFAYISLDEFTQLHEEANAWFDLGGALYFGWVIPAAAVLLVLSVLYLRFLLGLPRALRWRFLLAAVAYVGGALGVELVLGWWSDRAGEDNLGYALIDWVEESLEMIGVAIFLDALVGHLAGSEGGLHVEVPGPSRFAPVARAGAASAGAVGVLVAALLGLLQGGAGGFGEEREDSLEALDVTVFTREEAKEAATEVRLRVSDAAGLTLVERELAAGEAIPARSSRSLRLLFDPEPSLGACSDLALHVTASQSEGEWSWEAKLWAVARTGAGESFEVLSRSPAQRFGSDREAAANGVRLPLHCPP